MPSYISSNANRFYVAIETSYGQARPVTAGNRFPAIRLDAQQVLERSKRLDKSGARTFAGGSKDSRRHTAFEVRTYLTSWDGSTQPGYGPLFQAGMGAVPEISSGLSVASVQNSVQIQTTNPHQLSVGSAIRFADEMRFVTSVPDSSSVVINAPFTQTPNANSALGTTITYRVSTALPSVTLYDYWDPAGVLSRIVTGAAVDTLEVLVDGDYHELRFAGPAGDLLDSSSFVQGSAGLDSFPAEPTTAGFDYSIVPGHLGQAWIGGTGTRFYTLTDAAIEVKNDISLRSYEYGSSYPRAITAGLRQVAAHFTLFVQDDAETAALYTAAKRRQSMPAMLQLGQKQGELMGIFVPNVTPEIPEYDDSETRLKWQFRNNLAQGVADDEIYIAFG